jgi:hypothetical protein
MQQREILSCGGNLKNIVWPVSLKNVLTINLPRPQPTPGSFFPQHQVHGIPWPVKLGRPDPTASNIQGRGGNLGERSNRGEGQREEFAEMDQGKIFIDLFSQYI